MKRLIEVIGLRKEFDAKENGKKKKLIAVDDVTFSIEESQTYGLIGESGSGKTTVGRVLLRLIDPTSGKMIFEGREYQKMKSRQFLSIRRKTQMVFQDPFYSLNPNQTVWGNVAGSSRKKGKALEKAVRTAFDRVQIEESLYNKYPHQISMGQQQRTGIARAIVDTPKFIVLDEPTSSLDLSVRGEIMVLLVQLQKELKISYLFISHDLSTIKHMCHKVSIMYLGQVVESGDVNTVFGNTSHPYSRALLSSVMYPDPTIKRSDYKLKGEIPSPIDLPCACYLGKRCPEATEICFKERPPIKEIGKGHFVRCHNR